MGRPRTQGGGTSGVTKPACVVNTERPRESCPCVPAQGCEELSGATEVSAKLRELTNVSRLSIIGDMAEGISHELNQPLAAILNYTEACRLAIKANRADPDVLLADLQQIVEAAERAGRLIGRLRRLVRKRAPSHSSVDLSDVVRDISDMLAREADLAHVALRTELRSSGSLVQTDALLMSLVVISLARNGIEAMSECEADQRELTIRALTADDGNEVVEVIDRGPGVPSTRLGSIFMPFHSTKHDHVGLGLSLSQNIVEADGGKLTANHNSFGGMTFRVILPTTAGETT
ncbi:MAG: hypothetical protein JXO22_03325 [Phycisphaerae bacterium]|nr:hypothetical protein [Phycisphaerae bacterium]